MAKNKEIEEKIKNATTWSFLTEILAKIIVPLTNAILAHLLMPEAFGVVATINIVITFTDVLTESGFGQYLIQHEFETKQDYRESVNVAFLSNFAISTAIWALVYVFRSKISMSVGCEGYEIPLVVACLSIPISSFISIPTSVLQKELDYHSLFYNRIAGSLTSLVISTSLALLGFEHWALIIGTLSSNIAKTFILMVRSKWHPCLYFSFSKLKKMMSYSIWILLEAIAMWASNWIDIFLISHYFSSYYIGIYKTSQTTVTGILSVVTASVNSIVFVTLSKLKNNEDDFKNFFYSSQKKLAILVVPMGVGIYVYKKLITIILLGENWVEASEFLGIWGLCMAMVATMGTFCREALRAKGLPKTSLIVQILHLVFIVPVIWFSIGLGYSKLIYIRSFAYLQVILLLHIFVKINIGLSPRVIIINTLWPLVCATFMGGIGYLMNSYWGDRILLSFVGIFLCIVVYFISLIIIREYRNIVMDTVYACMAKFRMRNDKNTRSRI